MNLTKNLNKKQIAKLLAHNQNIYDTISGDMGRDEQ